MAEGIAFGLVKEVLGKLGSPLWNEIGLLRGFRDDADDLKSNLSAIQAVLLDAEERSNFEKESHALRDWLRKLKDAAYDADDLLDEIGTQAVLRQQQHEVQNQNQPAEKVRGFLSRANPVHLKFKHKMAHRMKELREKIDKIAKQSRDFGLAEAGTRRQAEFKRPETISVVDEEKIVGRRNDKEKIVKLLLEMSSDHNVSVIPIVGLGGLGKTTLAQQAFNDGQVTGEQRFDLLVWVCVSTDFDMKKIARPVISAARETCDDLDNPDAVARCLVRIFSQKTFLLVLDDVWNEDQDKWKNLKVLFKDGKKGSKILVTTRSEKVAEIMRTVEPYRVEGLSDDDCWTLFKRRAFKEREENDYPHLVEIGKQIVKKCGGSPLAANALGSLMRFKSKTEDAWLAIRDNEIWRLKEEETILPSLKLSYIQMSSALKQCFAYCSIFPKDYVIDKDDLIRQWIALGFISLHETRTSMEDIGNEYFNDLLWMSFLQDVEDIDGEVTTYRMHDLVHDLAQFVAGEEVAVIVGEKSTGISEGCRYASMHSRFMPEIPTTVLRRLRALQSRESGSLLTFYGEAKCLRLLDLHDYEIPMLPSSIGKLKLLRYLNLSGTNIQELPESITGLCNLQTLNLSECYMIHTLPKSLRRLQNLYALNLSHCVKLISLEPIDHLKNLHYLDLSYLNSLMTLPESIGSLQNLCILNLSNCSSLESLPSSLCHLKNLQDLDLSYLTSLGTLPESIGNLQNLCILNLSNCSSLESLPSSLCHLKNLQDLDLSYLTSLVTLPESIGSLQNLCILNLSNCSSLESLPSSLCHLKNLQDLDLSNLGSLVTLPESSGSLQNLRILNLCGCNSLLSLPSSSSDLQHLEKLYISYCGKLCELPKMIQKLTKLRDLLNNGCRDLMAMPRGIGKLVSLRELPVFVVGKQDRVEDCASISELEHLKLVGELEIKGLENVTNAADAKIANLIEKNLGSLKLKWNVLSAAVGMDTVPSAEEIDSVLENLQPHQNLEFLEIEGYAGGKFPSWMMSGIDSCLPNLVEITPVDIPICSSLPPLGQLPFLRALTIRNMPAITNLGVGKFPALTSLQLEGMPVLREWATVLTVDDKEGRRERVLLFPRLTELSLDGCPELRPEPCLPPSVEDLIIFRASKENLSLILERARMDSETPLDDGDGAVSPLQLPPNKGLQRLTIGKCRQLTCLPESLRSLTSLQRLAIWDCEDLERIEDWLGELTDLRYLSISGCSSLRYLPAHKMTTLEWLCIDGCPLLFDEAGQFVDTSVDHIKEVIVGDSTYICQKQVSSSPEEENSSPEEEESSPKEKKKSWTSCWSRSNWLESST